MFSITTGVNLHFFPYKKFKTACFCILIRRPLRREEVTLNAALPYILKSGCSKFQTIGKIQAEMDSLFGSIFECQIVKKGEWQILQFYLEGIAIGNNFYRGMAFLRDMMLEPLTDGESFREDYTVSGVRQLKDAIEGRANNKADYARNRCFEKMCVREAFGLQAGGYAEDLSDLDGAKLFRHYQNVLQTSPIDFLCLGDLEESELRVKTQKMFSDFPRGQLVEAPRPVNLTKWEKQIIFEKADTASGKLCVGLRRAATDNEKYYPMLAANEILGGGINSRLFTRLREQESLCYYIHSVYYRFKSIVLVESGVARENFEKATALIEEELDHIKEKHVSEDEFQSAVTGLIKKFQSGQDYPASIMDFHMTQFLYGDPDRLDEVIQKIRQVQLSEIAAAAQQFYVDTVYQLA